MTFHTPAGLILLAPWALLTWWLLARDHESHAVPFIALWRTDEAMASRPKRMMRRPPLAVVLLTAALLVAIVGGAGLSIQRSTAASANAQSAPTSRPSTPSISIVHASARATPVPAVMVRIRNESSVKATSVRLTTDGKREVSRAIDLPARGTERDYFFDTHPIDETLDIDLVNADVKRVRLVRRTAPAKLEAVTSLPSELARMIAVYSSSRPATERSARVIIADRLASLGEKAGVALVAASATDNASRRAPPRVVDHPITKNIHDWSAASRDATFTSAPIDGGWTPILSIDDRAIVAVREQPARQVWIGFHSNTFAREPGFVIFWTDIFNWLADNDRSTSEFAVDDASTNQPFTAPTLEWAKTSTSEPPRSLAPIALTLALALALAASLQWPAAKAQRVLT